MKIFFLYLKSPPVLSTTALTTTGATQTEVGKFGYFESTLTIDQSRYSNVTLTASSTSSSVTVCSIHIHVRI